MAKCPCSNVATFPATCAFTHRRAAMQLVKHKHTIVGRKMHLTKKGGTILFRLKSFTDDKLTTAVFGGATIGLAILLTLLFGHNGANIRHWPLLGEMNYLNRSLAVTDSIQAKSSNVDAYCCRLTCSIEIVESIPENITFDTDSLPTSTFSAWSRLISLAEKSIYIAAYKSSLRGKHVLGQPFPSTFMGEQIFEQLLKAGTEKDVTIRMVENYPAKDPGDNADGWSLESRGALERRLLHLTNEYGEGAMHSKFITVDDKHFYLGSANLDWRSLNQKMELGVLVLNCPCLANDLRNIFLSYWNLATPQNDSRRSKCRSDSSIPSTTINAATPIVLSYYGAETKVFLASSPRNLHEQGRTWDLEAITSAIRAAKHYIYIHVMDFIPMIVYQKRKSYWPIIDNALRKAVVERGVEVKILAAALHFVKENLHFMQSLQTLANCADNGTIEIKIFKVPSVTDFHRKIARDRRTHNKFMLTEDTVIIGTSNWSGDYFTTTTGIALVAHQKQEWRPLVDHMRHIFLRNWRSPYAHTLNTYIKLCLQGSRNDNVCEVEKNLTTMPSNALVKIN
ncbi:hypothetical protein M514_04796 [Trichuris suis]|uniref:PLD phosphodiesterase domain-containing protein n=1 Tax=Trichuris suis TaxID=68888 RepID=A0A085NUP5_9BILA|nr:hypothetical protein M514_04796 [Trichuris suis]